MKIQIGWLREHVEAPGSAREIGDRFTALGFALDGLAGDGDDAVLDLDVGSNRPDALSHRGLARELVVRADGEMKLRTLEIAEAPERAPDAVAIAVDAPDLCPRYCARVVRGVTVGPSPAWLAARLQACGIRPINVVVDVTNYVLLERGHPLHAFDLALLEGRRIVVRRATPGETLTTLDGQERKLDTEMLLIADGTRGIALAGIMGGANSEIRDSTRDIVIESAVFAPASIRRTSRALGLATEASQRFGRGCDPEAAPLAADAAAAMIAELAGGQVLTGLIDVAAPAWPPREPRVRMTRLRALSGVDVPRTEAERILRRLGFGIVSSDDEAITARVPSWRNDVAQEVDLIEEILRHHGFDKVPYSLPSFRAGAAPRRPWELSLRRIRETLAGAGCLQALHFTFDDPAEQRAWAFSLGDAHAGRIVELVHPMADNLAVMRVSLVPALLRSLASAIRRGEEDVRLFEEGPIFLSRQAAEDETPAEERPALALVAAGQAGQRHFLHAPGAADMLTLKGTLFSALVAAGASPGDIDVVAADVPHCAPGAAEVRYRGARIGWMGRVHPRVTEALEMAVPVHASEVALSEVIAKGPAPRGYAAQSRYPKMVRDLCVVVDRNQPLSVILNAVTGFRVSQGVGDDLIEAVELIDRYLGQGVPEDKVSLTFSVTYRRPDRTLTQDEVDARHQALLDILVRQAGAVLRS